VISYSDLQKYSPTVSLLLIVVGVGLVCTGAFSVAGVQASPSENSQTQLQMNDAACAEYKQADRELNRVYLKIVSDYRRDPVFIKALKKAQLAWLHYRDAHVDSIYPGAASQYGSVSTMCRCGSLTEITKERTQTLNRWLEGVEEGDVCAGSVRVK
jgi:uncharacterized protein YecT (DUF1311 family)